MTTPFEDLIRSTLSELAEETPTMTDPFTGAERRARLRRRTTLTLAGVGTAAVMLIAAPIAIAATRQPVDQRPAAPTVSPTPQSTDQPSYPTVAPTPQSTEEPSYPTVAPNPDSTEEPTVPPNPDSTEEPSYPTVAPNPDFTEEPPIRTVAPTPASVP
ncbi:hypothetical protein [Plantactinospora soyae]|uniref:Type IV secretory pathway VirB10-like protein n=1 Tax=Plantactinospora soyae TaxID=1544732 RepID=A0A927M1P3_9ACTN|nr:hypothetical protein [Plantactinospora soyae]MBE1485195.1 type IV secretory pathway VirB10-like protein [Plantactinospora soyae]